MEKEDEGGEEGGFDLKLRLTAHEQSEEEEEKR